MLHYEDCQEVFLKNRRNLEGECMNQKAKPHKPTLIVGEQNGIWVLGLCRLVSEEFEYNGEGSMTVFNVNSIILW